MKRVLYAMKPFLAEIMHDFMLIICIIMPIIMGVVFRFLLPVLENVLCEYFCLSHILSPYYILFDLLIAVMTPIMFSFSGVMVMLEEADNGLTAYFTVTPLGRRGYLMARIGVPIAVALVYDVILLLIFANVSLSFGMMVVFSLSSGMLALITSLLVVTFAKNKMEGMALIKLCGLLLVGIVVPYFLTSTVQYVFSILPTYWLAKLSITGNYLFFLPTVLTSFLFIAFLYRRFRTKIS